MHARMLKRQPFRTLGLPVPCCIAAGPDSSEKKKTYSLRLVYLYPNEKNV